MNKSWRTNSQFRPKKKNMDFRKIISGTNSKTCQKWSFWSLLAAAEHVCSRVAFVHPFERVSNAVFGWNLPLLGCLNYPRIAVRVLDGFSALRALFGPSRPKKRVGRGGRARCNVPWSLNKASNALMQSLLLSLNALWVLWLGRVADPKCIWVSILQIYQAFLCSWNFRISLQIPCNTAVFFAKIGP